MAVHVVGSINVDIIASVYSLPEPGETVLSSKVDRLPGGKGGNQAVAAARMGAATAMTGAVGDDESGRWMCGQLADAGIEVSGVQVLAEEQTGTAYIAVDGLGENQIIVAPGANWWLEPPEPVMDGVLLAQLEVPVVALATLFAQSSAIRILNAAPPVPQAVTMFDDVDILIVNEHELAVFLDRPEGGSAVEDALAARALLRRPGQVVVVTLGANGVVAVWSDRHLHVPAAPVLPVDTIGAGDCFCGALAALLDEGRTIEAALPIANAAAALCTLGHGAAPAMPMRAMVDAFAGVSATEHALAIKNANEAHLS